MNKPQPYPTASKWRLVRVKNLEIAKMRGVCLAYPGVCSACWGKELPDDAGESEILDAYDAMIAKNKTMRDIFDASFGCGP